MERLVDLQESELMTHGARFTLLKNSLEGLGLSTDSWAFVDGLILRLLTRSLDMRPYKVTPPFRFYDVEQTICFLVERVRAGEMEANDKLEVIKTCLDKVEQLLGLVSPLNDLLCPRGALDLWCTAKRVMLVKGTPQLYVHTHEPLVSINAAMFLADIFALCLHHYPHPSIAYAWPK